MIWIWLISAPNPVYLTGGNNAAWPKDDFQPDVDTTVLANQMTVSGDLDNGADFFYGGAFQATATAWVDGSPVQLTIDPTTYTISGPQIGVQDGSNIAIRFEATATISSGYDVQLVQRHDLTWSVPAGGGSASFDTTSNPMQSPSWDVDFGWDTTTGKLKWEHTPSDADGSTQDLKITTRLPDGSFESSSNFDQAVSAGAQTHTALFTQADASTGFEVWLEWENNAGNRTSLLAIKFNNTGAVNSYSPTPSTFEQNKVSDKAEWQP